MNSSSLTDVATSADALTETPSSTGLASVIAEDLETVCEALGEVYDMRDGPCDDTCGSWMCEQAGCIKDKADRARLFLSSEALRGSPSAASAATSVVDEQDLLSALEAAEARATRAETALEDAYREGVREGFNYGASDRSWRSTVVDRMWLDSDARFALSEKA